MFPAPEPALPLPAPIRAAVISHASWCLPEECCGLLAVDRVGRVRMAYPLTNIHASATSYTVDPAEHFAALQHAERHGWEIAGTFHSHPGGPAFLSRTDVDQPHPTDWVHLVVGFRPDQHVRAWRISSGRPREVALA